MDYLVHYGIKGQQHGVRRFQNEDGSLTAAGKLRYAKGLVENRKDVADVAGASADLVKEEGKANLNETKRQANDKIQSALEEAERKKYNTKKDHTLKEKIANAVNGPDAKAGRRHVKDTIGRLGDLKNVGMAKINLGIKTLKLEYKMNKSMSK